MNKKKDENFQILLVEDNPDDVLLTRVAFEDSRFDHQLHVVENGEEALKFLKKKGQYKNYPRPHLILLDLNLPRLSGIEVLEQLKQDSHLNVIPVVVLTTSTYEEDVLKCYKHHANCFITKPVDLDSFMSVVKLIEHFWFDVVTLPPYE